MRAGFLFLCSVCLLFLPSCKAKKKRAVVVDGGIVEVALDGGSAERQAALDAGLTIVYLDAGWLDALADLRTDLPRDARPSSSSGTAPESTAPESTAPTVAVVDVAAELVRARAESDLARRIDRLKALQKQSSSTTIALRAEVWVALGEAHDLHNEMLEAIDAYEQALELLPKLARVQARLQQLQRIASVEKGYSRTDQGHFVARYEGDADRAIAEEALKHLEEAWRTLGDFFGLHPPSVITVIFYGGKDYVDAVGGAEWSAGQYDGKIRVRTDAREVRRGKLRDLMFHEYTHALLRTTMTVELPRWLHEGLAQHVEPGIDRSDVAKLKRGRPLLGPRELRASFRGVGRDKIDTAYACALDMVDMLAEWRGERSFAALFAAIRQGKSVDDAIDDVYGLSPALFEERWRARFR